MMIIKKMDALSLAKIEGIIGVIVGFIAGIAIGIFSSIMSAMLKLAMSTEGSAGLFPMPSTGLFALGWLAVIVMPIAYGIMFFIAGLIGAWIYNLAARFVGGIKMELEYEQVQTTTTQQPVQPQPIRK